MAARCPKSAMSRQARYLFHTRIELVADKIRCSFRARNTQRFPAIAKAVKTAGYGGDTASFGRSEFGQARSLSKSCG